MNKTHSSSKNIQIKNKENKLYLGELEKFKQFLEEKKLLNKIKYMGYNSSINNSAKMRNNLSLSKSPGFFFKYFF